MCVALYTAQAKRIRGLFDKNQGLVRSLTSAGVKLQCCAWPRSADDRGIALCQVVNDHVSRLLWQYGDLQRFLRCNLHHGFAPCSAMTLRLTRCCADGAAGD